MSRKHHLDKSVAGAGQLSPLFIVAILGNQIAFITVIYYF